VTAKNITIHTRNSQKKLVAITTRFLGDRRANQLGYKNKKYAKGTGSGGASYRA